MIRTVVTEHIGAVLQDSNSQRPQVEFLARKKFTHSFQTTHEHVWLFSFHFLKWKLTRLTLFRHSHGLPVTWLAHVGVGSGITTITRTDWIHKVDPARPARPKIHEISRRFVSDVAPFAFQVPILGISEIGRPLCPPFQGTPGSQERNSQASGVWEVNHIPTNSAAGWNHGETLSRKWLFCAHLV